MEAKDTVMGKWEIGLVFDEIAPELAPFPTDNVPSACVAIARIQAEISFKAGYEQGRIDTELRTGLGQDKPS